MREILFIDEEDRERELKVIKKSEGTYKRVSHMAVPRFTEYDEVVISVRLVIYRYDPLLIN